MIFGDFIQEIKDERTSGETGTAAVLFFLGLLMVVYVLSVFGVLAFLVVWAATQAPHILLIAAVVVAVVGFLWSLTEPDSEDDE